MRPVPNASSLQVVLRRTVRTAQRQARRSERGATAAEYAVLLGFIVVVVAVGIGLFGQALEGLFESLVSRVSAQLG